MTRRQRRIIHQLEAEIEEKQVAISHILYDEGETAEVKLLRSKNTKLEQLLSVANRTFDEINNPQN